MFKVIIWRNQDSNPDNVVWFPGLCLQPQHLTIIHVKPGTVLGTRAFQELAIEQQRDRRKEAVTLQHEKGYRTGIQSLPGEPLMRDTSTKYQVEAGRGNQTEHLHCSLKKLELARGKRRRVQEEDCSKRKNGAGTGRGPEREGRVPSQPTAWCCRSTESTKGSLTCCCRAPMPSG